MNILMCPLSDGGYLYPSVAIGRELRRRGHRISVLGRVLLQHPGQGALTTLVAATSDLPGGSYVAPGGFAHRGSPEIAPPSRAARDDELARRLWRCRRV